MMDVISDLAVAVSLMREALSLLDDPASSRAASFLQQAIEETDKMDCQGLDEDPAGAEPAPPGEGA